MLARRASRWLSSVAGAAVLIAGVTVVSANASTAAGDTPGCVTQAEFQRVKTMGFHGERFGHRKDAIRRVFDTAGKKIQLPRAQQFWKNTHRRYRPCDRKRGVYVVNYVRPRLGASFRAYNKDRGCLEKGSMYVIPC